MMTYQDLIDVYDAIDEYIMDQQRESSKTESIEQKIVHEARATGASIALQILMRHNSLLITKAQKKREEKDRAIADKLKRDNGYDYLV